MMSSEIVLECNLINDMKRDSELYRILDNENHFYDGREFERALYPLLLNTSHSVWKNIAEDSSLDIVIRVRSAYLYTYMSNEYLDIRLTDFSTPFFYRTRPIEQDSLVTYYGLKSGIQTQRFEQYKTRGLF